MVNKNVLSLKWAPRQAIPGKYKMTVNQIHRFKSGEQISGETK